MKKFMKLACVSAVMLTALAGCGSSDKKADTDEKVLKIAGLNGGFGTGGWEAVAKKFEEMEGVKVELEFEKNISDVLRPRIQAGEDIPDIIYLAIGGEGGLTDTMVKEKQIQPIDDILDMTIPGTETKVSDNIIPGFTDALNLRPYDDGKLYLAPLNYSPCGLFYNAGLFKEKGWEVPTTWDEMFALGDKAKAEGISLFTYPTTGYFDAFFSALLNETAGPDAYEKMMHYDEKTWESAEAKQAFELVGKLADYIEPNTVAQANGTDFSKNQQAILDNKALFIPNGTWLPGEMEKAPRAEGFEWGMMALPKVSADGDAYSTTFTEQMYIPEGATNVDLAKKFMAYCYSDEAATLFYTKGKSAVMPTIHASDNIKDDDINKVFYSIYDNGAKANAVGFAALENQVEGVDLTTGEGILYGTVNSVMTKDKTVDQWYDEFITALKKVVEANK
ncbi:carbohydrate ABC transporter substrate-binding protein [Erysipelotrichaceae bacterium MTC7]|nr:carbohydrate ABC transporter substrate-binding protein [Erysipelotrichaceae bacterium MTC7]